jgi:hypothetical protein
VPLLQLNDPNRPSASQARPPSAATTAVPALPSARSGTGLPR